jgi:hypothetical protein
MMGEPDAVAHRGERDGALEIEPATDGTRRREQPVDGREIERRGHTAEGWLSRPRRASGGGAARCGRA